MLPTRWKATGHVDGLNDPIIDNNDTNKRFIAIVLNNYHCEKINYKAQKELEKARDHFREAFEEEQYKATNERVDGYISQQKEILQRMAKGLENGNLADVKALIEELGIADPETGSKNWTEVRQFNLMFGTKLGASAENAMELYLRP